MGDLKNTGPRLPAGSVGPQPAQRPMVRLASGRLVPFYGLPVLPGADSVLIHQAGQVSGEKKL